MFLYVGAESAYGGWVSAYAHEVYEMPVDDAAFLSSVYWVAMTAGRAVGGTANN
jgi:fucose permease